MKPIVCPHGIVGIKNCRPCVNARQRKWNAANQDKVKAKTEKWETKHPNYSSEWKAAHPGYAKQRYRDNPEKGRAASRKWAANNRSKALESCQRWNAANKEWKKEYCKKWRKLNPEKQAILQRRHKGVPLEVGGEIRHGQCPLCPRIGRLVPDHDHDSGRMRDWICPNCNLRLGSFERELKNGTFLPYVKEWKYKHAFYFSSTQAAD